MNRLTTRKAGIYVFDNLSKTEDEYIEKENQMVQKFGQLEDIEEELGIEFNTLLMALRNGIYTVEDGYIPPDFLLLKYNKKFSRLVDNRPSAIAGGTCFYLQGYGTLWALTKEELE